MKTISNLKVGTKISLFAFVLSSVILTSLILVIGYTTSALVEKRSFDEIAKVEQGVVNMIAIFNQTADSDVSRFSKLLASSFPGEFTLDPARTVPIAGKPVPVLKNGATDLNLEFSVLDAFTARTGVTATIFVKSGEDFVRIST